MPWRPAVERLFPDERDRSVLEFDRDSTRLLRRITMARWHMILCVVIVGVAVRRGEGQTGSAALQKELAGIGAMHHHLGEVIETKDLDEDMPFAKFLDELTRRTAKKAKITFRIDRDAFGSSYAAVTQAPVRLPAIPKQMSVGTALRIAVGQQKVDCVYRVDPTCVTITTPAHSLGPVHTASYDIRDLVEKSPERDRDAAPRRIVELIAGSARLPAGEAGSTEPVMQIRNGHQLVIRAAHRSIWR